MSRAVPCFGEPLLPPFNAVVTGLGSRDGRARGSHLSQGYRLLSPPEGEAIDQAQLTGLARE